MGDIFAYLRTSTEKQDINNQKQGVQLGKPKGTIQDSIYDKDRERIVELLELGLSARKISSDHLRYGSPSSLNYYIRTRKLREELAAD